MDPSPEAPVPVSSVRTAMTIGAATAALMLVVPMLPLLNRWSQSVSIIILIAGILYGMKYYRDKTGGFITYGKATGIGTLTAFFASIILAFIMYVTAKIDPSVIETYLEAAGATLQASGWPSGLIESSMEQMQRIVTPGFLAITAILSYSFMGVIIAAVCGLFMKNPDPNQPPYPL